MAPVAIAETKPILSAPTESMTDRVRKRSRIGFFGLSFRLALWVLLVGSPLVLGFFLLQRMEEFKKAVDNTPRQIVIREETKPREVPQLPREVPRQKVTRTPLDSLPPLPPDAKKVTIIEPQPDPLVAIPKTAALPGSSVVTPVTLFTVSRECSLSLATNSSELSLSGTAITWQEKDEKPIHIASVENKEGDVAFTWKEGASSEAVNALLNSVLEVSIGDELRGVALREPQLVKPVKFDLTKTVQRVVAILDPEPQYPYVRFDLVDDSALKVARYSESEQHAVALREELILWYASPGSVATRFSPRKRGTTVVVEISHGFALPSGDEEILTIARGNKKLRELERLYNSATNAANQISGLRSQLQSLQSEHRRVSGMRTTMLLNGVQVPDTAAAAQKQTTLQNLSGAISETQSLIAEGEQLVADRPAIDRELTTLVRISDFAKQLKETGRFSYRIYFVVGEHEVDLVVPSDTPPEIDS